jgi:hypothetical protein
MARNMITCRFKRKERLESHWLEKYSPKQYFAKFRQEEKYSSYSQEIRDFDDTRPLSSQIHGASYYSTTQRSV